MAYDAVLVLGGGACEGGELPPWVKNRCDRALQLAESAIVLTLSAGTVHKVQPRDAFGQPIFESVAAARYLVERGFPAERILSETSSYDTIGNAYFARAIHTDPAGLRRLLVITSEFHISRTQAIFRWIFAVPPLVCGYDLSFEAVPDVGMTPDALAARRAKEAESLAAVPALAVRCATLADVHRWLFTEHAAYAVAAAGEREPAPPRLLASY